MQKIVYNLYGVDQNGCNLSMFFDSAEDLRDFVSDCPGSYDVMVISGVDFQTLEIENSFTLSGFFQTL